MKSEPNKELQKFASRFMESQGAVLEENDGGFEALMPGSLAEALGTLEHIHINSGEGSGKEGTYSINYGSLLLEKMIDTACKKAPLLACRLQVDYLKKEGFERLINELYTFSISGGKIENQAKIKTPYLFLTCRYTAQSDEQKHGLIDLVFNLETGACIPEMAGLIFASGKNFIQVANPVSRDRQVERIMKCIKEQSRIILMEELKTFYETMARRFKRDSENLEEYYSALEKEMKKTLKRHRLSKKLVEERRRKIGLLPAELERKRNDLFKKYSIKVDVEPCAAVLIDTPAVRIIYSLLIGKRRDSISFTYNPVTMTLDPLVCQGCGRSITSIYICDNFHLLCSTCSAKCPLC
ncbi:MAG: hypothetical protein ACQEP5_08950 [Actinomycetota bacterium]